MNESIKGQDIRIAGYVLPLQVVEGRVTEFLLAPEMMGCAHNTPIPPSNQMIHVSYPSGIEDRGRTNAVMVVGEIQLEPANYNLFLVDGMMPVNVAYTAQVEDIISVPWAMMLRLRQPTESPGRDTGLGKNSSDHPERYDQQT